MKKIVSAMLSLTLLLGISAGAAPEQSAELQKAVAAVKKVVDIGDGYDDFTSYMETLKRGDETLNVWSLDWHSNDPWGYKSAEVTSTGQILNFYSHNEAMNQTGIGRVRRAQARKTANAFLEKVYPDIFSQFVESNDFDSGYYEGHSFVYQIEHKGILVEDLTVSISVDKFTGEIVSFNGLMAGYTVPTKYNDAKVLDSAAAKKAYMDEFGIALSYTSIYDYENNKATMKLVYNSGEGVLDAITGKADERDRMEPFHYDWNSEGVYEADTYKYEGSARPNYSDAELEEMEKVGKLISAQQAEQIAREAFPTIQKDEKLRYVSLYYNEWDDVYTWDLSFKDASVSINAMDKSIISFYMYTNETSTAPIKLTTAQAAEKAQAFVAKYANGFVSKMQSEEVFETDGTAYVSYTRMENGIPVSNDRIQVSVSLRTGEITSYYFNWTTNVTFPSAEGTITPEQAFDALKKIAKFELQYALLSDGTAAPYYEFSNGGLSVDAQTGEVIYPFGEPYEELSIVNSYDDLVGHWSEETVNILMENGYYISGKDFQPDHVITVREFLDYLTCSYFNSTEQEAYQMYYDKGIISEGENMNAPLTRNRAAVFVIRYLGQGLSAEKSDAFKNPFQDDITSTYLGFVTLAKHLGIFTADSNGNFDGNRTMTRAEAATVIYRTLTVYN